MIDARRSADWHGVRIFGARLAIVFVFAVPLLALGVDLAAIVCLKQTLNAFNNFSQILWICGVGIATMIAFAFGGKNGLAKIGFGLGGSTELGGEQPRPGAGE